MGTSSTMSKEWTLAIVEKQFQWTYIISNKKSKIIWPFVVICQKATHILEYKFWLKIWIADFSLKNVMLHASYTFSIICIFNIKSFHYWLNRYRGNSLHNTNLHNLIRNLCFRWSKIVFLWDINWHQVFFYSYRTTLLLLNIKH